MKHKIGEMIRIKEDFEIKTAIRENTIQVKEGDTGFMDSKGMIHYLTGEARNKIQKIDDIEVKGYDYESIAKLIFKRLNIEYNICEMLENEGIEGHEFRDTIEDVLTDIF
ncbi:hypothetical protein ACXATC_003560 [Clostridium sporogenes]